MRVRTIQTVNIRYGSPSPDAPIKGTLNAGYELEVEQVTGDSVDGNNVWYRDLNGDFLWSGDFTVVDEADTPVETPGQLVDYNQRIMNAYPAIGASKGRGVTVAVLDTGIYRNHPDFEQLIPQDHVLDFTGSVTGGDDVHGHGTHSTGLIAARTSDAIGIVGIAPECEVYTLKVIDDAGRTNAAALRSALDWIVQRDIDIVNMSLRLSTRDYPSVMDNIETISGSGSIIVGAAGDNETLMRSEPKYPAGDPYVLAAGTINKEFLTQHQGQPDFSEFVDVVMPYLQLRSTGLKRPDRLYFNEGGSSQATAIVSGLIALLTDQLKADGQFNPDGVKTALSDLGVEYGSGVDMDALTLIKT